MNSHNTITSATEEYAHFIDRTLYSFFKKGDTVHAIFEVCKTGDISAIDVISFIQNILGNIDLFNLVTGSNYDKSEIDIKINVQSPGPIEFFSNNIHAILLVGIAIVGLVGGKARFDFTKKQQSGELSTDGLLGKILKFRQEKNKHEVEIMKLQQEYERLKMQLKIKEPGE